jgi:multiple sugar transport system ATP-binding protein
VEGRIYTVEPTGDLTYAHVYLGSSIVVVSANPQLRLRADQPVWIGFDQARLHLFDAATGVRLVSH